MKIHRDEIDAACQAYSTTAGPGSASWEAALEAAYTVRKARKQAKRERQRKEKDKQVVESVKEAKPDELSIEDGLKRGQFLGLNSKTVAMMNPSKAHLSIMPADDEFIGVSG